MTESWRCFVAVPIGQELRATLGQAVDAWRERPDLAGLRWSEPENWHVTIAFLGAVATEEVHRIAEAIRSAGREREGFDLPTGGIGGFPSASRARVAWYGVSDPGGRLRSLAESVQLALGLPATTPFRGHITLARSRSAPVDLRTWLQSTRPPAGSLLVDRVELVRSHLGRGPARYEVVATTPFAVAAGV